MRQIIIISCLLSFCACQTETRKAASDYFDIKSFFKQEAVRLNTTGRALNKKLILGEKVESLKIEKPDWNKEFSAFMEIDLLLPGYNGKFSVDTISASDGEFEILYKRQDTKLLLSEVKLAFNEAHSLKRVSIIMSNQNSLYESHKELTYYTDSAYRIRGSQNIRLMNGADYEVDAQF